MNRTSLFVVFASAAALILTSTACGSSDSSGSSAPTGVQPTLSSIQANIITPSCALSTCHNAKDGVGNGWVGDTAADSYKNLVGAKSSHGEEGDILVKPGDSASSLLYILINEPQNGPDGQPTPDRGIDAGPMPEDAPQLSAADIAAVKEWIDNGALDN